MDREINIEPSPSGKGRKRMATKQEWKREKAKTLRFVSFQSFHDLNQLNNVFNSS